MVVDNTSTETVVSKIVMTKTVIESETSVFKERVSHLDHVSSLSELERSKFKGLFNALSLCTIAIAIGKPVVSYLDYGYFYNFEVLQEAFNHVGHVFFIVSIVILYSFLSVPLQRYFITSRCSERVASLLHHSLQSIMFIAAFPYAYHHQYPFFQSLFLTTEVLVIFMKMHAYNSSNRTFRKELLKKIAEHPKVDLLNEYPMNLTYGNFFYFLLTPTFLYETEYPRTERVRFWYIFINILSMLGVISMIYIVISEFISPFLQQSSSSVAQSVSTFLKLIIPTFTVFMLLFYFVFHCLCNGFAEITQFADREFYDDWWNSTGFDEFSRKWNKPVHKFLYRYVYLHLLENYNVSKYFASLLTFVFSALLHELLIWAVIGAFRPYMFGAMMFQIPLIAVMRPLRGKRVGNMMHWFGHLVAFPTFIVLYSVHYSVVQ